MRSMLRSGCVLLLALFSAGACTTRFQHVMAKVPNGTRVGVILAESDGDGTEYTLEKAYIYDAISKAGMVPVALNEIRMNEILGRKDADSSLLTWGTDQQTVRFSDDPILVTSLKKHLTELDVKLLLIVHVRTSALDQDLRAVAIRASKMDVVASRYYKKRVMAPLCVPMTLLLGLSVLVCPWMYLIDEDKNNYELVSDFLRSFV